MKYLLWGGVVVVVCTFFFIFIYMQSKENSDMTVPPSPQPQVYPSPLPTVAIGSPAKNNLVADEDSDGTHVRFTKVSLETPGFIVIQDTVQQKPKNILAVSDLLPAIDQEGIMIRLPRQIKEGEMLAATLVADDGDRVFTSFAKDIPLLRDDDSQIRITFEVETH